MGFRLGMRWRNDGGGGVGLNMEFEDQMDGHMHKLEYHLDGRWGWDMEATVGP